MKLKEFKENAITPLEDFCKRLGEKKVDREEFEDKVSQIINMIQSM